MEKQTKTVTIVGGGIGGLASAILLAKQGYKVSLYEKNECLGGRASIKHKDGYTFDMGPSRYLMPDIFEEFFESIDEDIHDYLDLKQLSPSYRVFYDSRDALLEHPQEESGYADIENRHIKSTSLQYLDIYADSQRMSNIFESMEPGAGKQFLTFLDRAKIQYEIGMEFCKKNYDSIFDFFRREIMWKGIKLNIRTTIDRYVARFFKNQLIRKIMQYTTVFLGTAPKQTPALYNIMSHCDFNMGVWYPKGGLHEIARALHQIGLKYRVEYHLNTEIVGCEISRDDLLGRPQNKIKNLETKDGKQIQSDIYLINADMAWFETNILPKESQTYPKSYRDKKIFAPSGFIIYAGVNKKLPKLDHHNLYFCEDRDKNFGQIFDTKELPDNPSIYVSKITHTDPTMAPEGCENLFILVPIPNGIEISNNQKEQYKKMVRGIVEQMAGEDIVGHISVEEIFTVDNFKSRYNSWKGTALGLAHPIMQTAVFRPNNISKKLDNLFYVGHNTNPGIGVPMVIISAKLALERIMKKFTL